MGERRPARYHAELDALFATWPEPVRTVLSGTPATGIHKLYVHDHDPIARWHRRNLIAIGDAAHASLPTSGQGACQALEDAWQLAAHLSGAQAGLDAALTAFTTLRRDKTVGVTMAGRAIAASLFSSDPEVCARRNTASRQADFAAQADAMARGWSQHLPLPRPA